MAEDTGPSPFQLSAMADFETLAADFGCGAAYTPVGGSVTTDVRIVVMADAPMPGSPARLDARNGPSFTRTPVRVLAPAMTPAEIETTPGSGVGDAGGIRHLKPGDTFAVPARVMHREGTGTVTLRVGPNVELSGGVQWTAEVSA